MSINKVEFFDVDNEEILLVINVNLASPSIGQNLSVKGVEFQVTDLKEILEESLLRVYVKAI